MLSQPLSARPQPVRQPARQPDQPAAVDPAVAALQMLLRVERDARRAATPAELHDLVGNETRPLVGARQVFVLAHDPVSGAMRVAAVSSLTAVDREAPFVQWIEALVARRLAGATQPATLDCGDEPAEASDHAAHYPFPHLLALPLADRAGAPLGLLLLAREAAWDEDSRRVAERLAECYAHAWSGFRRPSPAWSTLKRPGTIGMAALGVLALLALTPTRITALAPFSIVPDRPFVVAASGDGTIETVAVEPNSLVAAGQVLYTTVSTPLRDNLVVAERAMAVADAKWKQFQQSAFVDPQAKRELAAAQAEVELRRAERDYARDLVERTVTRAPRAGLVIFDDANDLVGRPVVTGQRLMAIADRTRVLARVEVPVDDAIVLDDGARVRLFLDSAPTRAVEAALAHASHEAQPTPGNGLAYRADARLAADETVPRLGLRGTAEVYGPRSSLLLYLFRRPLSYVRQHYGL